MRPTNRIEFDLGVSELSAVLKGTGFGITRTFARNCGACALIASAIAWDTACNRAAPEYDRICPFGPRCTWTQTSPCPRLRSIIGNQNVLVTKISFCGSIQCTRIE